MDFIAATGFRGGLAQFELELIRSRTGEGRKRAMANGIKFGRKHKLSPHQQAEILKRRANGEPLSVLAASYSVNRKTIMRLGSAQ